MARYVTFEELKAKLPLTHLTDATDDDRDGEADVDVVDAICANACTKVDSYLEQRYTVPILAANYGGVMPSIVTRGALIFAISDVYARRGLDMPAELLGELSEVKRMLREIQAGDAPLVSGAVTTETSRVGAAITECAAINASLG